jgi:MFS family permease
MIGPLLASAAMLFTGDLRVVFALAAVPAALAMAFLVFGVREDPLAPAPGASGRPPAREAGREAEWGRPFRRYLLVLAVFTLGNSSDAFLLLRAQDAGVGLASLPILWTLHHLVKAGASAWGGGLSDRVGRRNAILAGWAAYAASYAGFALARSPLEVSLLFAFYGLFHALTEGPERALVADLARAERRGTAFGIYHAVTGGMLLPASLLTGGLWQLFGPAAALGAGAGLAVIAALGLLLLVPEPTSGLTRGGKAV